MALVAIGGILGFFAGLGGLVLLDLSWLEAVALWAGGGPAGAVASVLRCVARPGSPGGDDRPTLARIA